MTVDHGSADYSGLVGRTIAGGLRVTAREGSTAQGPLYLAEYHDGGQVLLLVVLSRVPGQEPPAVQSFRLAARIRHPNVAAVRAVGELEEGSAYYVVLEQLAGEPLENQLAERSPLPLGEALDLAVQVAAGLEAAHEVGLVHGNVSPGSIVVSRPPYGSAQVKLVGFSVDPDGLRTIKLEPAGVLYASPERLGGGQPDARSDVFSLGAVLHHLLSGRSPRGHRALGDVPRLARSVLEQALAPSPAARYQTMSELRAALEHLTTAAAEPRRPGIRWRVLLPAVAAGVVLVAGGLLLPPLWRGAETRLNGLVSRPSPAEPATVASGSSTRSTRSTRAGGVAAERRTGAARAPASGGGGDRVEASEPQGYVGDAPSGEPAEGGGPPPPAARNRPGNSPPPKPDPPRPRPVLEQYPPLQHAIGDVTRIGLAENVVESRPGVLVVHLAANGMGVPSARYNLQRLYLAYSAATRQQDTVAIELRRNREIYGWFTRAGLRLASDLIPQ